MKFTIKSSGFKVIRTRWERMAQRLNRELPSLVMQAARTCAINMGYHTQPYGFSEVTANQFKLAVAAEVARVFTTRQQASGVYLLMRRVDPVKAEQYWAAHKKGSHRRALDILNSVALPNQPDISVLKAARVSKNAHVPKRYTPRVLLTAPQQRALIKQQQDLVGLAKAGWYQAARSLGRVRSGVVRADGSRTSEEIFPNYIRRVARQHAGLGSSRLTHQRNHARCTVSTNVRHANNALSSVNRAKAQDSANEAFRKACRDSISAIIRSRARMAA
jgi:hypothetical protein